MRKISELTPDDFPGVDAEKFAAWKEAEKSAGKNQMIATAILIGAAIITIPLIGGAIGYFLPLLAYFAFSIFVGMPNGKKARRLMEELGITRAAIQEARRREPPE